MEPKFETLAAFLLVGCPQYANPKNLCPGLAWGRLSAIKNMFSLTDPEVEFAVEVYPPDFPQNEFTFYYMAGIPSELLKPDMTKHLFIKEIPEAEYAVFPVEDNNTDNVGAAFQHAYRTWLPESDYEAKQGYDLERYRHQPDKCFEVMIPVARKSV